ncbi:MAG TPA: hypothetical protein VGJ15_12350 [Pirellulales bacterium]
MKSVDEPSRRKWSRTCCLLIGCFAAVLTLAAGCASDAKKNATKSHHSSGVINDFPTAAQAGVLPEKSAK